MISNGEKIFENSEAGYLLRTKIVGTADGGVAAGNAYLDSIALK